MRTRHRRPHGPWLAIAIALAVMAVAVGVRPAQVAADDAGARPAPIAGPDAASTAPADGASRAPDAGARDAALADDAAAPGADGGAGPAPHTEPATPAMRVTGPDGGAADRDGGAAVVDGGAAIAAADATGAAIAVDAVIADAGTVDAGPPDARPAPPDLTFLGVTPGGGRDVDDGPSVVEAELRQTGARTLFAIKLILGLIVLAILAYLGGHRSVVRLQERLGIANVIAAGLPFVALGLFASHPRIGILTGDVLTRMRPILEFGLGWLGFIIGAQLDIRVLDRVPRGTAYLIVVEAIAPFVVTATACGALMLAFGASLADGSLWRDLVLLGTAAAMTAPRRFRGFANRTWREGKSADMLLAQLDEIVGVVGLLFLTAYFRGDTAGTWQLPDTAWLFVSLGIGVAFGAVMFAVLRVPVSNAEFLAVVLGTISFASGLAGYLGLSPIVICFIAGTLVINFPCDQRDSLFRILNHLERPIHVLFLVIAGAVWAVGDWRGWVLVPLFVAARTVGKWLGIVGANATVGADLPAEFTDQRTLFSPLSSLSIALVVSVESLHRAPTLAWITTAVIGGAFVIELIVQFLPDAPAPRLVRPDRSGSFDRPPSMSAGDSGAERPPMKPRPRTVFPTPAVPVPIPPLPVATTTPTTIAAVPAAPAAPSAAADTAPASVGPGSRGGDGDPT